MTPGVEQQLGRLIEAVDGLRREFDKQADTMRAYELSGQQGRRALHERVEQFTQRTDERFRRIEADLATAAALGLATQEHVAQVKASIEDIQPKVQSWTDTRRLGLGIVGIIALGGTAFGASLIWWGETIAGLIRKLLRID